MRSLVMAAVLLFALPATARAAEGDIIVQRAPGLDSAERQALHTEAGVKLVATLPLERTELVSAADPAKALAALQADDDVVYAEADRRVGLTRAMDDTTFGMLWGLENTGQADAFGQLGTPGDDIDATSAWDQTEGAGVTVAVVDTGILASHVDLADQIASNAGELGGRTGVDDDHNGYVDDVHGWDWVQRDNVPQDAHGHGTHVSGTIVAEGNNHAGVVGVAPQAKVLPLRVLDASGSGYMSNIASAFDYAGDLGVRIVNASLGGGYSHALEDAVADHPNTLYVVAAGNDAADSDVESDAFPCALPEANLVCVGATDNRDAIASFSNYGATAVDLFAPGVGIYSTTNTSNNSSYRYLSGTSMASPHVAGAAALALSVRPDATTAFLRWSVLSSVDAKAGLTGLSVTGGRLNAAAAVNAIQGTQPAPTPTPTPTPVPPAPTPTPVAPVATPTPVAPVADPPPPVVAPALTKLSVGGSLRSKASKLRVSFRLSGSAWVRFTVQQKGSKRVLASWNKLGRPGANAFVVRRTLPSGAKLKRGAYTLGVAVSATASSSKVIRVS